jgi:hypothetical protein
MLTDKVQVACGLIMIACIIAIALYFALFHDEESSFVFVAETAALIAFGVSWLTEGLDLKYELR